MAAANLPPDATTRSPGRAWAEAAVLLVAAIVAACAGPAASASPGPSIVPTSSAGPGAPGAVGLIPRCGNLPSVAARPEAYSAGATLADESTLMALMEWGRGKPGFEEIWIDRDQHDGWITLAFSSDALLRQLELASAFPGVAAVVVEVPWTMAGLQALQQRVITEGRPDVVASGIRPQNGVVTIGVQVLFPDVVARVEAKFGGNPVCIEGADPAAVPPDGPQPQAGNGWRLLTDQDRVGAPYRTGIAAEADGYAALWAEVGLAGEPPEVDFEAEVVVWFGAVHGSSCPRLRLDDVVAEAGLLHAVISRWEFGVCTADAIGHAYVVAVQRMRLPPGGFTIQLQAAAPPGGVIDQERTVVRGDLTVPGSTLSPD